MTVPFGSPFDSQPASRSSAHLSPWSNATSNSSYPVAALRAAAISLVLLAFLAILVIF